MSISPWISYYRVNLKCEGISVVAFVDAASFHDLAPRDGEEVLVFFDPQAAHVILLDARWSPLHAAQAYQT